MAGTREALAQAISNSDTTVNLDLRDQLYPPFSGPDGAWRMVESLENHDLMVGAADHTTSTAIAALADPSNARFIVAQPVQGGIRPALTAPGVPMLFMGQEFLDESWSNDAAITTAPLW